MAVAKRTTTQATITGLAATVDLSELQTVLTNINDSAMFRQDDASSGTTSASTHTVDFDDFDYYVLTMGINSEINFSNILQGEVKYLLISNAGHYTWTFHSSVVDHTYSIANHVNLETVTYYRVFNKNGTVNVEIAGQDLFSATDGEMQTGSSTSLLSTASGTKHVNRHGYKALSNAESYAVVDGIGLIEIPSGVSGGTITMPDPTSYSGHVIRIFSSGGSGPYVVRYGGGTLTIIVANYTYEYVCNGTQWTQIIGQAI